MILIAFVCFFALVGAWLMAPHGRESAAPAPAPAAMTAPLGEVAA